MSLFLIQSFAVSFHHYLNQNYLELLGRDEPPQGSKVSTNTPIVIPKAVTIDAIVIPCSRNKILIFSPNVVSECNALEIVSLILEIWLPNLYFKSEMLFSYPSRISS